MSRYCHTFMDRVKRHLIASGQLEAEYKRRESERNKEKRERSDDKNRQ